MKKDQLQELRDKTIDELQEMVTDARKQLTKVVCKPWKAKASAFKSVKLSAALPAI